MEELEPLLDNGWNLMRLNEYKKAQVVFLKAVEKAPNHIGAIRSLATSFLKMNLFNESEMYLRQALALDRFDCKSIDLLADVLGKENKIKDQLDMVKLLVKCQPTNENYVRLCRCYIQLNHLDEAISTIKYISQVDPEYSKSYIKVASALHVIGDNSKAINLLTEGMKAVRHDPAMLSLRGRLYIFTLDYENAFNDLNELIGIKKNPFNLRYFAISAMETARIDEALWAIEEAIKIKKNEPSYYQLKGIILYKNSRIEEAIDTLQYCLALSKNKPSIKLLQNIGIAYYKYGNLDNAKSFLGQSIALAKEKNKKVVQYADSMICLAEICHINTDYEGMKKYLKEAFSSSLINTNNEKDIKIENEDDDYIPSLRISTPILRSETRVQKIIRDTVTVCKMKELYEFKCQICGDRIVVGNNKYYCEVHHLKPLGGRHNGPDIVSNMLVVCPNHHKALDYGSLCVVPDTLKVYEYDGTKVNVIGTLNILADHRLESEFLQYHLENIFLAKLE